MSQRSRSAAKNRPLSALPGPDRQHLLARCQQVKLRFGDVLCRPGQHIRHVLFPADSFVSLITPIDGRTRLELGLVGDEGMLGISLMLGVSAAPLAPWCRARARPGEWRRRHFAVSSNTARRCNDL